MSEYTLYPFYSAPSVPFKFDGRILFTSGQYELVHLSLLPGECMEMHTQPFDVVFFVAEGTGTLRVGGESCNAAENTTIHVNADVQRAWANEGTQPLRILVSKLLNVV